MNNISSIPKRPKTIYLLLPIIAAIVVYGRALDLFFVWDDFIWVDRGRTLMTAPRQMLNIDVMYFDPLVHILFWVQHTIAGTTPWFYHVVNLCLHVTNSVLLYRLAWSISGGDSFLAMVASTIFSVTVTATDAVVWPSSAVDLLAVMFTLVSIIFFLSFLQTSLKAHLLVSLVAFCAALASKGTPVVLPAILAVLIAIQHGPKKAAVAVVPFAAIAGIYLLTVRLVSGGSGTGMAATTGINSKNFLVGLTALITPERVMFHSWQLWLVGSIAFVVAGIFIGIRSGRYLIPMFFALAVAIFATAPLAALKDVSLVGPSTSEVLLLTSPSHRLYLASIGMALFFATALRSLFSRLETQRWQRDLAFLVVLVFVSWNYYEVGQRLKTWRTAADTVQKEVESLSQFKQEIRKDSPVGLVGFTMSRGFIQPMLASWFDAGETTILPIITVPENVPDEPTLLSRWKNASFFVRKNDKTYSLTPHFQTLLSTALRYNLARTEDERTAFHRQYLYDVSRINSAILQR